MLATTTGFAGGTTTDPTYKQVCTKTTGHAEVVRVVYDTRELSTADLLIEFFSLHDFTIDRRGKGGQYRSVILLDPSSPHTQKQEVAVQTAFGRLRAANLLPATEFGLAEHFYPAENRHQQYCSVHGITPKRRLVEDIREILTN